MKALFIVTGLEKASGITTFIVNVADELRKQGHHIDILTKSSPDSECLNLNCYDVIHFHGLWSPWLHSIAKKVRALRRLSRSIVSPSPSSSVLVSSTRPPTLVWSPHGMLQKWALKNKFWKKLPALALYQWRDLSSADLLHATALSEVDDIRRLGFRNKVVVAPLGVRIRVVKGGCEQRDVKTLLFVSRVQRKKGLPNLIEAWGRLSKVVLKDEGGHRNQRPMTDGWQVRIVGPDEDNHVSELKAQCDRLGLNYEDLTHHCSTSHSTFDVVFAGPKYGEDLVSEYTNADLFVLPTHSENFGSVVVEALAHGVPVITTKEAPWEELEEFKCGWWIVDDVDKLTEALSEAIRSGDLREMGARGRKLVESRYTWSAVCDKMIQGYEEALNGRA